MQTITIRFLLKYLLTAFILILVPVYIHYYGLQNFLWLSDVGLFLTLIGLWWNRALFISMATVCVFLTEFIWNIDYFAELFFGVNLIDLSDYMFDESYSLFLRSLSLFHVALPIIWIWYLYKHGYDRRAFKYGTLMYWTILICTYIGTDSTANINWVFLPEVSPLPVHIPSLVWVIILAVAFPLFIFLPTHLICSAVFKKSKSV